MINLFRFLPVMFISIALQPVTSSLHSVSAQPMSSADKVNVETLISVDNVEQGSEFKVALIMDIEDSWHINANRPSLEYLIGTELTFSPHDQFVVADIRYPEPKSYEFAFAAGEELLVYEGRAPLFVVLRTSSSMDPGEYTLKGTLRVQACDDQVCLAPSNIPIEVIIPVVEAGTQTQQQHQDLFSEYESAVSAALGLGSAGGNEIAAIFDSQGNVLAFLAIFLIGLALNLTPCVYPMLSVTVSIFGSQTEKRAAMIFSKALVYVLGIATMYSALGVAAALSGGLFGAWLQSPWVLGFIGLLFLGLALSMFGFYELQMPYWLTSRLGAGNSTGFVGTYLSGLVVGIFAAPCIGPPIIALLAFVGAQGDPMFGFQAFFILSLGLGLPYLILGTFTGLIQKMPKSGVWMVWVKKVFGVILVGLALFYVGLALYPQHVLYVIPLTLIAGGIYLGFFESSGEGKPMFKRFKYGLGIAGVIFGFMVMMNLQKEGMAWEPYSEERLQSAIASGNPVILDFYADWCIPCLELDRLTFTDEAVIAATDPMVKLKVDLTHFDSPESEALRQRFGVAGVPTIIFLDEKGEEVSAARVIGFMPPADFLRQIEKVNPDFVADAG